MIPSLERPSLMRSRSTYPDRRRSLADGRTKPATVSRATVGSLKFSRTERTPKSASSRRSRGT